jgi:hypothetical protein
MTYMLNGQQHIVVASGGLQGAEFICLRLPGARPAAFGGRGGRGAPGAAPAGRGAPAAGRGPAPAAGNGGD